jgi:hypothetical protein
MIALYILTEAVCVYLQLCAVMWERKNDGGEKGDTNKKRDVWIRAGIILLTATFGYFLRSLNFLHIESLWQVLIGIGKVYLLAIGLFFLVFDYAINRKRGRKDWFAYLGDGKDDGTIDNIKWWKHMHPVWRLVVRIAFFILTLIIYFN